MQSDAPAHTETVNYRGLLEEEHEQLVAKLDEIGFGADGTVSSNGLSYDPNFADSSQVTAERGEAEALASQLRDTLDEVEMALTKLESGEYGNCESCGQPINPARLEAMPTARLCIDCAAKSR